MPFELNRIDGTSALPSLRPDNVLVDGEDAEIDLLMSGGHSIGLIFPAPGGVVESGWLELAADVLVHLTEIDNQVQAVCAEQWEWAGTPYPSSYYEGVLVFITLTEASEAVLHYYVIGCNSEWDERFIRIDGRWSRVQQTQPSA